MQIINTVEPVADMRFTGGNTLMSRYNLFQVKHTKSMECLSIVGHLLQMMTQSNDQIIDIKHQASNQFHHRLQTQLCQE